MAELSYTHIKMTKRRFFLKKISHIFACESQFLNHICFLRNPQLLYNSYWAQILFILPSFPVCFVVSCPSFLSLEPEQETVHVSCVLSSSHFWKNRAWVSLLFRTTAERLMRKCNLHSARRMSIGRMLLGW